MSSSLTVPALTYRQVKGSELTATEIDHNFKALETFGNSLSSFFGTTVGTDGTLKADSVLEVNIKDRQIGASKLKFSFLPIAQDSGSAGTYVIAFTPALAAYEDLLVFWVVPKNSNQGPSTLNVNNLGAKSILKGSGIPLEAADISASQPFIVVYLNGAFRMVGGTGSGSSSGSTVSSIAKFESLVDVPSVGVAVQFGHGFGDVPTIDARLQCAIPVLITELGYATGDEIALSEFVDASGNPAFTVSANDSNFSVLLNVGTVYLARKDAPIGTYAAITLTNWKLRVIAQLSSQTAGPLFPALDIQAASPDGAIGYGTDLFYIGKGVTGKAQIVKVDQTTNIASLVYTHAAAMGGNQFNIFRDSTGKDRATWFNGIGCFWMYLDDPATVTEYGNLPGDLSSYRPCEVDETDSSPTTPSIYSVSCNSTGVTTTTIPAHKSKVTSGVDAPATNYGSPLSLVNGGIANVTAFSDWHPVAANILLFQYNHVSKRIYVVTAANQLMHIFRTGTLSGGVWTLASGDFKDWWVDAGRYSKLTYEKAISIGSGTSPGTGKVNYVVEFDLTTGKEKAIYITRESPGVVSRVPWAE